MTGHIRITSAFRPTDYWASLVHEPTIVQSGRGITSVAASFAPGSVPPPAVIAVDVADVRPAPSMTSGVMGQVKYAQRFDIVDWRDGWLGIRLPDGRTGWIVIGSIANGSSGD